MSDETTMDFTGKNYLMDMWEFFNNNSHYTLLKYSPIKGGIRAFYTKIN